ncbi:MAG: hypothetical protein K6A72_09055 [Lachnospiraceae bacterium]|nr:hypothetical protein [Lachnospiraceae bacterium]
MINQKNAVTLKAVSRKLIFKQSRKDGKGTFYNFIIPGYGSICLNTDAVKYSRDEWGNKVADKMDICLGSEGKEFKVSIKNNNNKYSYTSHSAKEIQTAWSENQKQYFEKQQFERTA